LIKKTFGLKFHLQKRLEAHEHIPVPKIVVFIMLDEVSRHVKTTLSSHSLAFVHVELTFFFVVQICKTVSQYLVEGQPHAPPLQIRPIELSQSASFEHVPPEAVCLKGKLFLFFKDNDSKCY
jgi:hypothetical protein